MEEESQQQVLVEASFRASKALKTHALLQQASAFAHARVNVPVPAESKSRSVPLLPVSVGLTQQDMDVRKHVLYKMGETAWDPKQAASRMAWTLGLQEKDEKSLEEEFTKSISSYKRHASAVEAGHGSLISDMRVLLPVYVKRGSQALRDEVVFHFGSLGGVGAAMAGAVHEYAMTVCRDLGLNAAWFRTVMRYMGNLVTDVNEDIKASGTSDLVLQQAGPEAVLRPKPHELPRVEDVTPELEAAEDERKRRRDEKIRLRQRLKKEAQMQLLQQQQQLEATSTSVIDGASQQGGSVPPPAQGAATGSQQAGDVSPTEHTQSGALGQAYSEQQVQQQPQLQVQQQTTAGPGTGLAPGEGLQPAGLAAGPGQTALPHI